MDIKSLGGIFGGGALQFLIPGLLTQLGVQLQKKDDNETGFDDEGGKLLVAFAPVVPALLSNDAALRTRVLTAVYDTLGNILGKTPTA